MTTALLIVIGVLLVALAILGRMYDARGREISRLDALGRALADRWGWTMARRSATSRRLHGLRSRLWVHRILTHQMADEVRGAAEENAALRAALTAAGRVPAGKREMATEVMGQRWEAQ